MPPLLQHVISVSGWREGFLALAMIGFAVGMPLVLLLMPRGAAMTAAAQPLVGGAGARKDSSYFKERDFWLLAVANFLVNIAISGAISQLSPMIQDEGLSAATAALGLSAFAVGQFIGKIGGGWLLDRLDPRLVAVALTGIPGLGFGAFLMHASLFGPVMAACAVLGVLQGADMGIFAYFVGRRFGVARYGTVFGALHGLGWIGTALGIILFGMSFDRMGSYAPIQAAAIGLLAIAACMFLPIRFANEDPPAQA